YVRIGPVALFAGFLALVFGQSSSVENRARAVIEGKCLTCHGAARTSDLDLRQTASILKGGKRGPAIVPGKAEVSLLYKAVRREGELQMPPGKTPLAPSEIAILRDWINSGAHSPSELTTAAASWWSFRKPERTLIPAVRDTAWVRNPVDAFIAA